MSHNLAVLMMTSWQWYNIIFSVLPYELGRLFQLQTLGLNGNPLQSDLIELYSSPNGTYELIGYLLDNQPLNLEPPGMILPFSRNFTEESWDFGKILAENFYKIK